jgi:hypothetical protein
MRGSKVQTLNKFIAKYIIKLPEVSEGKEPYDLSTAYKIK